MTDLLDLLALAKLVSATYIAVAGLGDKVPVPGDEVLPTKDLMSYKTYNKYFSIRSFYIFKKNISFSLCTFTYFAALR